MGILDRLMSSDPMVSAQRRGILESLASMSGPQPIAPSMGQVAGAVSAGARQGKRDYLTDEMSKFQYMTMDDGSFVKFNKLTGEMETIDKFPKATGTSYQIGNKNDEEALKKLKPNFNTSDYAPGTIVTIEKDKTLSFKEPNKKGTTLSQSQLKTNGEIKQARKTLTASYEKWKESSPDNKDKSLGDYVYATSVKKNSLTGMDEPDYETFTMKTAQKAMQKLYGEDQDFEATFNAIFDSSPNSSSLYKDLESGDNEDSKSWFAETMQDWFGSKSTNPVEELDKMKTMPQDKAQEYYNTLPKKIQEQIRQIYNQ